MKYTMSPQERKLRKLAMACMPGGHMMRVSSPAEARKAQALGAVRVLGSSDATDLSIPTLFEEHNRQVMCAALEQYVRGSGEIPDEYILRKVLTPHDGFPSFMLINSPEELDQALLNDSDPFLVVTANQNLIPGIRAGLPDDLAPIYLMVASISDAKAAYGRPEPEVPDGLLMQFLPDASDLEDLYRIQGQCPFGWTRATDYLIGVLSLQGDYKFHIRELRKAVSSDRLTARVGIVPVRTSIELENVDALVLPGGWSNVQSKMIRVQEMESAIKDFARLACRTNAAERRPVLGVCAGMILARSKDGEACEDRLALCLIPMSIDNNVLNDVYDVTGFGEEVFSNAPVATLQDCDAAAFAVLATIATPGKHHHKIVGLRYDNVTAFGFHEGIHRLFLQTCLKAWRCSR